MANIRFISFAKVHVRIYSWQVFYCLLEHYHCKQDFCLTFVVYFILQIKEGLVGVISITSYFLRGDMARKPVWNLGLQECKSVKKNGWEGDDLFPEQNSRCCDCFCRLISSYPPYWERNGFVSSFLPCLHRLGELEQRLEIISRLCIS